jgi:YbbR domain-containing protein
MKKEDILHVGSLCFLVGFIIFLTIVNQQIKNSIPNIDLPEEFNEHTISQDRAKPTELMAIYDTVGKKYIIEFMDK